MTRVRNIICLSKILKFDAKHSKTQNKFLFWLQFHQNNQNHDLHQRTLMQATQEKMLQPVICLITDPNIAAPVSPHQFPVSACQAESVSGPSWQLPSKCVLIVPASPSGNHWRCQFEFHNLPLEAFVALHCIEVFFIGCKM